MSTLGSKLGQDDRWFSVSEVAAHLGVATDTVYRWIDTKGLPAHRVGRLWKCKLPEVDAWVRAGGPAGSADAEGSGPQGTGKK
jgi:excisionase family DNA binding protein